MGGPGSLRGISAVSYIIGYPHTRVCIANKDVDRPMGSWVWHTCLMTSLDNW